jgi:arylsulfatase A-like enzyme/cytochrome c-type biogenesis protein CcmH/NrfG
VSVVSAVVIFGCGRAPRPTSARNLVIITIDTLRADHVGAYGYARARTPTLDTLAQHGVVFDRAYSAAPITLTSHATLLTGRYPPGHGARDNGLHVSPTVPTLATMLQAKGFKTAAFVAAFPLDHQFGLNRGFDVYDDQLPRAANGRLLNERPASQVVDQAIAWWRDVESRVPNPESRRIFLWVHFFEPHAPYGDPSSGRSTIDRYDDEIATADREAGRLLAALGPAAADTAVVVAGDHGEAFGEHGEYAHSIFVYDTTLRVPLIVAAPGLRATRVPDAVTLADVAPTAERLLGESMGDVDGVDLAPVWTGGSLPHRELYAESFAPLIEFGWAPLRAIRSDTWKYIAAPTPELFDLAHDASETKNVVAEQTTVARQLDQRASRYSPPSLDANAATPPDAAERLRALGYASGSNHQTPATGPRPDPKTMKELAGRIAQVTSGELTGDALVSALETIGRADPGNAQVHLRLGFAYLQRGDCAKAVPQLSAAVNTGLPSADAFIGIATCLGRANDLTGAERALAEAQRREPDNPVVTANIGILQLSRNELAQAIASFSKALARDPGLDEARFNLAIAYAKAGRRADAVSAATDLLNRLPPQAPQRAEVERLLRALQ